MACLIIIPQDGEFYGAFHDVLMGAPRRKSAVYDAEYQYIIRRVREAREEAGLTQQKVAEALGRPLSFVSKCERGDRRIDPVDLGKFADLYGKPLDYFYPQRRVRAKRSAGAGRSGQRPKDS
jgi:DNA-binding XRE family transcriptional regulator